MAEIEGISWPTMGNSIAAVIAHYGDPTITRQCVEDLHSQRYVGRLHVIVADDASPIPYRDDLQSTVVRRSVNGGFAAAVNEGVSAASEDWLLILNSDVRMHDSFIAEVLESAAPWQPAICGVRQLSNSGRDPASGNFPTIFSTFAQHAYCVVRVLRLVGKSASDLTGSELDRTGPVDWLVGSALLMPRLLFVALGGFDSRFFMYLEEVDFQRRARLLGVRSILLDNLSIFHHAGLSSNGIDPNVELLRSRLLYSGKWDGARGRRALICLLVLGFLLDEGAHSIAGVFRLGRKGSEFRARWQVLQAAMQAKPRPLLTGAARRTRPDRAQ